MRTRSIRSLFTPFMLAAVAGSGFAWADTAEGRSSAAARYEVERSVCLRGQSHQDVDTCLREAAAARAQASRLGPLDDATQFEANRLQRCAPLPDDDRADCVARMQGRGSTSGSVEGGGIYRELTTIIEYDDASNSKRP